jgi:hypothetical protein
MAWTNQGHWACDKHNVIVDTPAHCYLCLWDLLDECRTRLDAYHLAGRPLGGPDGELAQRIDELRKQREERRGNTTG